MLKEYIVLMFGDENRTTSSIRNANAIEKCVRDVKETVHLTLSKFLKCCSKPSPGHGLKNDVSKPGS